MGLHRDSPRLDLSPVLGERDRESDRISGGIARILRWVLGSGAQGSSRGDEAAEGAKVYNRERERRSANLRQF